MGTATQTSADVAAIKMAYAEQIASGSTPENAFVLATIAYQQRRPNVCFDEAHALVIDLLRPD